MDIAREHQVARASVSLLLKKVKDNPKYVEELLSIDAINHYVQN